MPSINMDAQWLRDLAAGKNGGPDEGFNDQILARLELIAQHLESMDERLQNLASRESHLEMLARQHVERSNLPEIAAAELEDGARILEHIKSKGITRKRPEEEKPSKLAALGIKLNFANLGIKEKEE